LFEHKESYRSALGRIRRDIAASLRAYGVRWCLVHRTAHAEPHPSPGESHELEQITVFAAAEKLSFARRWTVGDGAAASPASAVQVCELAGADPLAFRVESPARPLPVRLDGQGIHVDVGEAAAAGYVVVNFLYHPDLLYAYVDGQPATITWDRWERMIVHVPPHSRELAVLCQPSWGRGLFVGCALFFLGVLGMMAGSGRGAGGREQGAGSGEQGAGSGERRRR